MRGRWTVTMVMFGMLVGIAPFTCEAVNAAQPSWRSSGVTAARPGIGLVRSHQLLATGNPGLGDHASRNNAQAGEGTGKSFCGRYGGYVLGANFQDVYACGPAYGNADDFDTVGFQCVELSERYLWVAHGVDIPDVPDGRALVSMGGSVLGLPIGTPGPGILPAPGDVMSLWGGPAANMYGHTVVVTSLNVDANGNGVINVMEQNGAASGWDQVNVSNWMETYGDPQYAGGAYYYNHVDWLELQPNTNPQPSTLEYGIQGLGKHSVASGLNDAGVVTGYVQHRQANGTVQAQPFLVGPTGWVHPASPAPSTETVGINDSGGVAAVAPVANAAPVGYALHVKPSTIWETLPLPGTSITTDQATSINGWGDISGWLSTAKNRAPSLGVVWTHEHYSYSIRTLQANPYFQNPVVNQADHWGDAIGSEMRNSWKTVAVLWTPWGQAYRLPPLASAAAYSVAKAMLSPASGTTRNLTVVGSSDDANGVSQACEWHVTVSNHQVMVGTPISLGSPAIPFPSSAIDINKAGWVVGNLGVSGQSGQAFLWRPSIGMVNLQSLVAPANKWIILSVSAINGSGAITGQGYKQEGPAWLAPRGIVIQPGTVPQSG